MIPYMGCKQYIADKILETIPSAENFYDLFGGGGSISEAASVFKDVNQDVLCRTRKWQHVHYNELNTGVYLLNKQIWSGEFDIETAYNTWVSRDDFYRLKDEPTAWGAFVKYCWSFSNSGSDYMYGPELEVYRYFTHILVNSHDFMSGATRYEKSDFISKLIRKYIKTHGNQTHYTLGTICKRNKELACIERLSVLDSISSNGITFQKKKTINGRRYLKNGEALGVITMSNKDYRDVDIRENSVVYCDIPYKTRCNTKTDPYYGTAFDWTAFYDWVATRDFPVYFSEYNCDDSRFECVLEIEKYNQLSQKKSISVERLYRSRHVCD